MSTSCNIQTMLSTAAIHTATVDNELISWTPKNGDPIQIDRSKVLIPGEEYWTEDWMAIRQRYATLIAKAITYSQLQGSLYAILPESAPYRALFRAVEEAADWVSQAESHFEWAKTVLQIPVDEVTGEALCYAVGTNGRHAKSLRIHWNRETGKRSIKMIDPFEDDRDERISRVTDYIWPEGESYPLSIIDPETGEKYYVEVYDDAYEYDRVGRNAADRWNPDAKLSQEFYWDAHRDLVNALDAYGLACKEILEEEKKMAADGDPIADECVELKEAYFKALREIFPQLNDEGIDRCHKWDERFVFHFKADPFDGTPCVEVIPMQG